MRNKYFAIIYNGVLKKKTPRQIHKELFDATINKKVYSKDLLDYAGKLANKAKKLDNKQPRDEVALLILPLFLTDTSRKIINADLRSRETKGKKVIIKEFITENRKAGRWYYLASSHNDCAKDHLAYQGKIYVDEKAPDEFKAGFNTIQWVMDDPAYFITRPNCRHYFVSIENDEVHHKGLKKKYHTHSDEGDRDFATPATEAIKEYTERLALLKTLYAQHPTEKLKRMIEKTELLLKKWKKLV